MRQTGGETHPIDELTDVLVDGQVRASSELGVRRQPRGERRVRQEELALRQRLAEGLGEGGDPGLGRAVALVHRIQVLVVDIDAVQLVRGDELRHRVSRGDRVCTLGRRLVGFAEGGHDDVDARRSVLGLLGRTLVGGQRSERASLIERTVERQERQRNDVVALSEVRQRPWLLGANEG